jgi:hypothetical protein
LSERTALLISDKLEYHLADHDAFAQEQWQSAFRSKNMVHCLAGFRVPALPVAREERIASGVYLAQVLHRFVVFIRALHDPSRYRAVALHVMAHPERSNLGAEVGIYLLCRAADESLAVAAGEVERLSLQVGQLFPTDSLFNYDTPVRLSTEELRLVTLQNVPDTELRVVELRKFEDTLASASPAARFVPAGAGIDCIPHSYWADTLLDPWLALIETLSVQTAPVAVSVVLEPTTLVEREAVATLAQQYRLIVEEGGRRADLLDHAAPGTAEAPQNRSLLQMLSLARAYRAQGLSDTLIARARRGAHVYSQLLAWQDNVFTLRVTLAARGSVPTALLYAVRAALSAPSPDIPGGNLGWVRPAEATPTNASDRAYAFQNLRWLGQTVWGHFETHPKLRRLRHLVTAQEAVGLFHLPVMPQAGQTTALSTADVPFVVPPEVASTRRFQAGEELVNIGYLYQRERCLSPDRVGAANALAFQLRLSDLEKPSLLVGVPGSGKSNLALHLLIQIWHEHRVPFLVLDPSTGHEYRYLYADPSLRDHLVVYSLGDEAGLPFRFNPFDVPPDVTARGHLTRLLACFKAAYDMWDPLPAIYEAALARVYTGAPYRWLLDAKQSLDEHGRGRPSPCLADFAQAVMDELEENVLPDYGKGTEASGILTGASKIRVNSILNNLGHILNVRNSDPGFFQRLLDRPVVIEMGALGDPSSIALVMAFLITALRGHIEHAHRRGARAHQPHLLLIEEAHLLLSGETASTTGPNQGNARGKSAEEMNTLLAEVRKFRQGIMVLDQRPSSLVGGVLDNALINIMCRLNDRRGFEHLSNLLNLSVEQQRYARSRLKPGDALMLDAESGQPILLRAPNIVDRLRDAQLESQEQWQQARRNAARANLLPPAAEIPTVSRPPRADTDGDALHWPLLDPLLDESLVDTLQRALTQANWQDSARQIIRGWLMRQRAMINPVLEQTAFAMAVKRFAGDEAAALIAAFRQSE